MNHAAHKIGYTLIEVAVILVLVSLLAGFSFQAVMSGTELYVTATRDYLELFEEGKNALEKMVRELRETYPDNVTVGTGYISFTKKTDHATPLDPSLSITFMHTQITGVLTRQSGAGTYTLAENVDSFTPSQNLDGVVNLDLVLTRNNSLVHLRTAVYPRQNI